MTEAQRRVMVACIKVKGTILDPIDELFAAYEQHAAEQEREIQRLRNNRELGAIETSRIKQGALAELWDILGATTQQEARRAIGLLTYKQDVLRDMEESLHGLFDHLGVKTYADAVETIRLLK